MAGGEKPAWGADAAASDEPLTAPERDELAELRQVVAAFGSVQIRSLHPEPRQSLPVRAAKVAVTGGYRLTKGAAAVLGLLVAIAEVIAPNHSVMKALFKALFEAL